jgi:hypothetical protein
LHPPGGQLQRLRQCAHQQGLAEAGNSFDEHVPGSHQREHRFFDDARLPDDCLADAGAQLSEQISRFLDGACFSFHVPTF